MRQLFKRERASKRIQLSDGTEIPSGLGTIREVVLVNNEIQLADGTSENLLNISIGHTDLDDATNFTHSSHTNQEDTLVAILKQNGYKEGVEGLQHVIDEHYATYEDGQRMMSHIAHRLNKSDANKAFPLYVRYIPVNAQYLHFNGVLRDKWGLHITGVSDALIAQMRELYDMSCAFDLLYIPATSSEPAKFTVIDFAYDAYYSARRRLYSNFDLETHLDTCVNNEEELDAYIKASIDSDSNAHTIASHTFIVKQSSCLYQFGRVMTGAFTMSIYDATDTAISATIDIIIDVTTDMTHTSANMEVENDIRGMCITRGVLV